LGVGNRARITAQGIQTIEAGAGGILLQAGGGSGADTDNAAFITQVGTATGSGQTITVRDGGAIVMQGGSSTFTNGGSLLGSGHGSRALIEAQGDWQGIQFTDGGSLSLTGGSAGQRAFAHIYGAVNVQRIEGVVQNRSSGTGPVITLTGGSAGGAAGEGNSATIAMAGDGASPLQVLRATSLTLTSGAGGTDNSATVSAPVQSIDVLGTVRLQAGGSAGAGGARIGGPGVASLSAGTSLSMSVGTDLVLQGGNVSTAGSAIGSAGATTNGAPTNISLNVGGSLQLLTGNGQESRIGSPAGFAGGGTIDVTAAQGIEIAAGSAIRTTGSVTLSTTGTASSANIVLGGLVEAGSGNFTTASSLSSVSQSGTGTLRLTGGTMSVTSAGFTQAGVVELASGATLRRGESFTNTGLIGGSGTIDVGSGTLTNQGTLAPGGLGQTGVLTVAGHLALGTLSTLAIDLANGAHDSVAVTQSAVVGGGLSVGTLGGFIPDSGQNFDVVSATGSLSGAFAAPDTRFAATVTLVVTASGVAAFGIGAAFWGLIAGLGVHALEKARR
jgi:hypothetical protein